MADLASTATLPTVAVGVAPVSAIVPTRNRATVLQRTLASLGNQGTFPAELIVVDASTDDSSRNVLRQFEADMEDRRCRVVWQQAVVAGAAAQRNQGVALATQPLIGFFDDDILFEPDCIESLWRALAHDPGLGGVNAMITNQRYQPPGFASRTVFGEARTSYAGRVLGPARPSSGHRRRGMAELGCHALPALAARLKITADAEEFLRSSGNLTHDRAIAVSQGQFDCARGVWSFDRDWARTIFEEIQSRHPGFEPEGSAAPLRYRLVAKLLGFSAAEHVAELKRQLSFASRRSTPGHDRQDPRCKP